MTDAGSSQSPPPQQQCDLLGFDRADIDAIADPEIRTRWPKDLAAMLDVVEAALADWLPPEQAARLAAATVYALARYQGGRMFYLPVGKSLKTALRDREIWRGYRHTRDDVQRIMGKYDLCEQAVYKILKRQRAIDVARRQQQLGL